MDMTIMMTTTEMMMSFLKNPEPEPDQIEMNRQTTEIRS
jgi:hypothetical protein